MAPEDMYGPDDPAYGPPPPGWRKRDPGDEPRAAESAAAVASEADPSAVRGPFEPLRAEDRLAGDLPSADPWPEDDWPGYGAAEFGGPGHEDAGRLADGQGDSNESGDGYPDAGRDASAGDLTAGLDAEEIEEPDVLDFGSPSDPEAGRLGDLRDLYTRAEEIDPARLDRHFDELLDRQRKLISEYFATSGPPVPPEPSPSGLPFGFDSAETLAGLRGDLRGAPS